MQLNAATHFYVSPTGSPNGDGSLTAPWNSIETAKAELRAFNGSMTDDIVVNVLPGEYPVSATITFSPQDSGTNGHYIIYRSANSVGNAISYGTAYIRGGAQHAFADGPGNLWTVVLSPKPSAIPNLASGSTSANSSLMWPARYPNQVKKGRYPGSRANYLVSTDGPSDMSGVEWMEFSDGSFPVPDGNYRSIASAHVVWWKQSGSLEPGESYHPRDWGLQSDPLDHVTSGPRRVYFDVQGESTVSNSGDDRFFVEGLSMLLDDNGEFFYDPATGVLEVYSTTNPSGNVWVPKVDTVFHFAGAGETDRVHHIQLQGFSICYSAGGGAAGDGVKGAIEMNQSENIVVDSCDIFAIGSAAVIMDGPNSQNTVKNSAIRHCGISGVVIENSNDRIEPYDPLKVSKGHLVSNCLIEDIGELYTSTIRTAGVALLYVQDCTVSHCEISNTTRYATTLRGNYDTKDSDNDNGKNFAKNNIFEFIRATDCATDSGDMGIIHCTMLNNQGGGKINTWRQILVSGGYYDSTAYSPGLTDTEPRGLYVDRGYPATNTGSCHDQIFQNLKILWVDGDRARVKNDQNWRSNYLQLTNCNFALAEPSAPQDPGTEFDTVNESNISGSIGVISGNPYKNINTIIVDDHTINYTENGNAQGDQSSDWTNGSVSGRYKGDCRSHEAQTTSQYAEWRPHVPTTGTYKIHVWKANGQGYSDKAKFVINPGSIYEKAKTVDLTSATLDDAGTWAFLGYGYFQAGPADAASRSVRLLANNRVYADALMFQFHSTTPPPAGLPTPSAWWKFEQSGGDSSGNGNGISFSPSGPLYGAGAAVGDHCMVLNTARYGSVTDNTTYLDMGTSHMSISLWFYRNQNSATNLRLVCKGANTDAQEGYCIWGSNNQINASISAGGTFARETASKGYGNINKWHHLAVVIDRTARTITVYIDGEPGQPETFTTAFNAEVINSADALFIGRSTNSSNPLNWDGKIDDLRIYKGLKLTPEQIADLASPE